MTCVTEINLSLAGFLCLVAAGLMLCAGKSEGQDVNREGLQQALAGLEAKVEKAKEQEVPILYTEVPVHTENSIRDQAEIGTTQR